MDQLHDQSAAESSVHSAATPIEPVQPSQPPDPAARVYTLCGIGLLIFAAAVSAIPWGRVYPVFVDTYYHMAVIQGFGQAGGIPLKAFWELAPAGRSHVYPPALHAIGYVVSLIGITPRMFITLVSWAFYGGCMFTTWLWMRRIAGPRAALFAVAFLCGPAAFFWNQSAHTANALVLVIAPLALLALESEKFLICAVLNFVAMAAHPIGMFLPVALVINALLRFRRKKIPAFLFGVLAAGVPVLLYAPWIGHAWAYRAAIAERRTGGGWARIGDHVPLSLLMMVPAVLALAWLAIRRRAALGLIGAALGFVVVFPIGFGPRFFTFNVHWPLACLGGFGLAELLRLLERRSLLRPIAHVASVCVVLAAMTFSPDLLVRLPRPGQQEARRRPGPPRRDPPAWHVGARPAVLPGLFEANRRPGPGPGSPGPSQIQAPGADAFFEAVRRRVAPGDVIFVRSPPDGALITGVTGRWTSSGMLRDVGPTGRRPDPRVCDFAVVPRVDSFPMRRRGPFGRPPDGRGPPGFQKVFDNQFASLWRNPVKPRHDRKAGSAVVGLPLLVMLVVAGLALVVLDLRPALWPRWRKLAVPVNALVAAACLAPLASAAVGELSNPAPPPAERPGRRSGPPQMRRREMIGRKHQLILGMTRRHTAMGLSPDYFWPREEEDHLRGLMEDGRLDEADALLSRALQIVREVTGGEEFRRRVGGPPATK